MPVSCWCRGSSFDSPGLSLFMTLFLGKALHVIRSSFVPVLLAATLLCGIDSRDCAAADDGSKPQLRTLAKAGPQKGSAIHSFFVRAVTGPHRNRSVCYVCRYGSRPVVMVLMQKVDPRVSRLLKEVDRIVDGHRATGLRGFGVLVTDESSQAVPILQTMAFDEKIRLPLTAATTAVAGPGCHNLHPDAATTIVLYRNQKAVEAIPLRHGEINARVVRDVARKLEEFSREPKSEASGD